MKLETKQLIDKNKTAFLAGILIEASVIITALVSLSHGISGAGIARLIVGVAALIVNCAAIKPLQGTQIYRHICCSSMILLFAIILFTADVSYTYAYVFPIAILVMNYADAKLSLAGFVVAIGGTLLYEIGALNRGLVGMEELTFEISMVVIACALALVITKMQIVHENEHMNEVQQHAEAQTKTAQKIVTLAEQLDQKFVKAKEVSDSLNETMKTSNQAVSDIAEGTHRNADAINEQTNQTSGIQQSIERVGDEARNMGEISERTNSTVAEGVDLIEHLKNQASEIAQINEKTGETTQKLNDSIKDVEAITDTILGISSQTNLLALNASIEAARAGEAGKGFAVVASEIGTLANQTLGTVQNIDQTVSDVVTAVTNMSDCLQSTTEFLETKVLSGYSGFMDISNQYAKDADEYKNSMNLIQDSISELTEAMNHISGSISEITNNINEGSSGISGIAERTSHMAEVTVENSQQAESSRTSLDELKDVINKISL